MPLRRSVSIPSRRVTGSSAEVGLHSIIFLIVVGSSIWVLIDSSRLGAKRGALGGGFLDMGPVGWFAVTLLLWIVGLPCYLAIRPRLVTRRRALATYGHLLSPSVRMATPGWQPPAGVLGSDGPTARLVRRSGRPSGWSLVGRIPVDRTHLLIRPRLRSGSRRATPKWQGEISVVLAQA